MKSKTAVRTKPKVQVDPREFDLSDTLDDTLQERGNRYGDFTDNAGIAQRIKNIMRGHHALPTGWGNLDAVKQEALDQIAAKISRILSPGADTSYTDNWHDIAGYAKLAEDRCK